MRGRLPLFIASLALVVALTGITPADAVRAVKRAAFAENAGKVGGVAVSRKPTPGRLLPLDSSARFPASVIPPLPAPRGPQGPEGARGEPGPPGPIGETGPPGPTASSFAHYIGPTGHPVGEAVAPNGTQIISTAPSPGLVDAAGPLELGYAGRVMVTASVDFTAASSTTRLGCTVDLRPSGAGTYAAISPQIDANMGPSHGSITVTGSAERAPGSYDARLRCLTQPASGTATVFDAYLLVWAVAD